MADVGCRNTVFGAEAQTDIPSIPKWTAAGIRNYRLEFVHETAEQVAAIAESFGRFFHGLATESEVETVLAKNLSFGTTEGSLFVPKNFQDLIQLK
jgi:putative protease